MCDINRWVAYMPRMFTDAGEEFGQEKLVKQKEKVGLNNKKKITKMTLAIFFKNIFKEESNEKR